MKHYRLSRLAQSDLDRAWVQVAENAGFEAADSLIDEVEECFFLLAHHPAAGRARPEIDSDIRSFPIQNYIIYYKQDSGRVLIARVLHGSRDQLSAFQFPF